MRLFFVECKNQYTLDMIEHLAQTEYKVTHAGSDLSHKEEKALKKVAAFKNVTFLDAHKLYERSSLRKNYQDYFVSIDTSALEFFNEVEFDFYTLTDRSNYDSVSFRERKTYFRDLIRFWLGYLHQEKIEAVYSPYAPHVGWELVLMRAAKYLNIPFVYFSHTAINNRSLFRTSYQEIDVVPDSYLDDLNIEQIKEQIDSELIKDFKAESIVTAAIKAENDEFHKQATNTDMDIVSELDKNKGQAVQSVSLSLKLKRIAGFIYHNIIGRYKRQFYLPMASDKSSSLATWNKAMRKHEKHAKELKAFYERHAKEVNLSKKYVYFPMHLQPEMTTQPEAGLFEDHLLVLEHILEALPKGWKVYVKENPRQCDVSINSVSAINFRDTRDLKDMLALSDKVHFVPQNVPTPELIKNAQAVVTQTGTVGWECLNLGKPIISFAKPWYSGCRACFKVSNPKELENALKKAKGMSSNEVETALIKFIHYYQDKLFIGSLSDPTNIAYNTRSYDELLSCHESALIKFLENYELGAVSHRAEIAI